MFRGKGVFDEIVASDELFQEGVKAVFVTVYDFSECSFIAGPVAGEEFGIGLCLYAGLYHSALYMDTRITLVLYSILVELEGL